MDGTTYAMEQPFLAIATQNPIEQEGTYRLPEAQLDRFLFKIIIDYPNLEQEITQENWEDKVEVIAFLQEKIELIDWYMEDLINKKN